MLFVLAALSTLSLAEFCFAEPKDRYKQILHQSIADGTYAGELVVQIDGQVIYQKAFGSLTPNSNTSHMTDSEWRWASVTKMVTALLTLEQVEAGRINLDAVLTEYLDNVPEHFGSISVRQLLNHTSGLINPDSDENLSWYKDKQPTRHYCDSLPAALPGERFEYNNCDFIVLADVLSAVTGLSYKALIEKRLQQDLGLSSVRLVTKSNDDAEIAGYADAKRVDRGFQLSVYGAGGAIVGSPSDLTALNHWLMSGQLLREQATLEMFTTGDPGIGYVALGVWGYEVTPTGCDQPLRLVERRGDIEGVKVLTVLDINNDRSFAIFSNRAETDWGWIWARQGISAELASAAFCQ